MNGVVALARIELILLLRNKTAASIGVAMPLLIGVAFALTHRDGGWAAPITMQLLTVHGLAVYVSTTMALVGRRQDLSLKRLRTGEATDGVILAGVMTPMVVMGLLQGVLMPAIAVLAGAPMPSNVAAVAVAVIGGTAFAAGAALATAAFTATAETAQITASPLVVAMFVGALWVLSVPVVTPWMLAVPGAAVAELVRAGVEGGRPLSGSVVALTGWTGGMVVVGVRFFRWDPRG